MGRIALITGANQGLGFALAEGLAQRMDAGDVVHLTGRSRERVEAAAARIAGARAEVRPGVLDVRDSAAIAAYAAELGAIDVLFANATARTTPERSWAEQIDAQVETSNYATTAILRAFHPRLRPGGRLIVVASSLGRLSQLPPELRDRFREDMTLDQLDAVVAHWAQLVREGREAEEHWPEWINVPSKVAQVAAVRILARERREHGAPAGTLVAAACPGLVDTASSRPWFDDMTAAQTPAEAARALLELALGPLDPGFEGELVRRGEVL